MPLLSTQISDPLIYFSSPENTLNKTVSDIFSTFETLKSNVSISPKLLLPDTPSSRALCVDLSGQKNANSAANCEQNDMGQSPNSSLNKSGAEGIKIINEFETVEIIDLVNGKDEKVLSESILMKNVDTRTDEKVGVNRSLEIDDDLQRHLLDAISIDRELSEKRRQDMIKVDINLDLTTENDQKCPIFGPQNGQTDVDLGILGISFDEEINYQDNLSINASPVNCHERKKGDELIENNAIIDPETSKNNSFEHLGAIPKSKNPVKKVKKPSIKCKNMVKNTASKDMSIKK